MPDRCLQSLVCPLPEDIKNLKGAGEFDLALALIEERLAGDLPAMLRQRLEVEKYLLPQLANAYTLTHEQLLLAMRQRVRSFTDQELEKLLSEGKLDFIYVNGTRYYHEDTVGSLLKSQHALNLRANPAYDEDRTQLDGVIRRMMARDLTFHYRLRATTLVRTLEPDTLYRIHMPIAARSMQQAPAEDVQSSILLVSCDAEDAPQRTAYLESSLRTTPEFTTEYTVTQHPRYVNAMDESIHEIIYPDARPVCDEDLMEQPPHIVFTPYIRSLARELAGEETDPVRLARRFYDYITKYVTYAFMRPYRQLETGAEYTAVNLRGDCGMQAMCFIALCRAAGIPARWQSGLYAAPGDVGSHDWAEFYSERLGWLPVDCSFGGSAYKMKSDLRWNFYFGNLDPWRMVANRMYFAPFAPEKKYHRVDPYDNQRGEIENGNRGLRGGEFRTRYEMLWCEESEK
ncbi:MAG: transglutaminase domain-containing protein [Clostridia bacterium]|nr:transglutaminase domain-containing protein [Clostridia bacterium]